MNTFKKVFGLIILLIAAIAMASGQTNDSCCQSKGPTIGAGGRFQAGNLDEAGNYNIEFQMQTTLYFSPEKKGFNVFMHGNAMLTKTDPMWAFFGLGFGYRVKFKTKKAYTVPSFIDAGFGFGLQTMKAPWIDPATNRLMEDPPMRGLGFINGQIPFGRINSPRLLIFQAGMDMAFLQDNSPLSIRYRGRIVYQVSDFPSDINLFLGLHAEKTLAHGFTAGLQFDKNRIGLYGIVGASFVPGPKFSGGFQFQANF